MHEFTRELLERLWRGNPRFEEVSARLAEECATMSPVNAGVIGRDLLLRIRRLTTKEFALAAYLASDGLAGNDGLIDFRDCVAILPEDRFQRLAENPDELINDEVSTGFCEYSFVSRITDVFDRALIEGEQGLLRYLVFGDEDSEGTVSDTLSEDEARSRLPRLYEKFGHLLRQAHSPTAALHSDRVTLDDFIH